MVARTPPKPRKKMVAPLDPNQLRDTLNKVEKCLNRLQELEYVTGGTKVKSGVNLRWKQESLRYGKNQKSPPGKLPTQIGEWKKMSLPAMILGETMGEILQATRFAREIVSATTTTIDASDQKTLVTASRRKSRLNPESTDLRARRKREKQIIRPEPHSPLLQRTKSRINFKVSGSPAKPETKKENYRFSANRVSPKNRPSARKTVIFPNPLFGSSSNLQNQKISRTESPVIPRNRPVTPHKFLIRTPPAKAAAGPAAASVMKFQVKIRSPTVAVSPARAATGAAKKKVASPPKKVSAATKLRRSFSPSRLASRLVSPLKNRRWCLDGGDGMMIMNMNMNMMSGLKQRPVLTVD